MMFNKIEVNSNKLEPGFYEREDVVTIGRELLGKVLISRIDGHLTKGIIVETEAYAGRNDKACHANNDRRTKRTEIMYQAGGHAYIYLCYGIHHLFNVVTNVAGKADAVLIRALEPLAGSDVMAERLNANNHWLTNGPAMLTKSMGITKQLTGISLLGDRIWIEDAPAIPPEEIVQTTRVGIDYAKEDSLLPWRFYMKGNKWVSRK